MTPTTRDYFAYYDLGPNSPYEQYIAPGTTPVAFNAELPAPIYADGTGKAPKLVQLFRTHTFSHPVTGWEIEAGCFWYRPPANPEFHPEVMLLNPRDILEVVKSQKYQLVPSGL